MKPRLAFAGFFAAMIAVHATVGWWQPLQVDDWAHLQWDVNHNGSWLATHFTFCDMLGYALAHSVALHAAVSALATAALVLGAFVIARRRLPRTDDWGDVLGVIAISALIWIAQPRAGLVWFHRPHVACHVCGCAVALWLIAPLRCGWRVRGGGMVALAIAGLVVGTSSRQIALATLAGVAFAVRRTPPADRARWMWVALGGLIAGTLIGFVDPPYMEPWKILKRGFEPLLITLTLPIREGGQLIALVMLLALAKLVLDQLRPGAPAVAIPEPRETHAWFWAWFGICVVCLFGPRYSEATLLPASLVLAIAALPYVAWLCATRVLRWAIIAIVIGVHATAWITALTVFARLGGEFRARIATLEHAAPGSIAVIPPYSEVSPTDWFFGEDWASPSRQLTGIDLFGVRDIEFAPKFRKLEDNPRLALRFESEGLSAAQRAAVTPAYWATEATSARHQFEAFAKRAVRAAGTSFAARLVVGGLAFPERKQRPLEVAWYEHGELTSPRVAHSAPDPNDRQVVTLAPALAALYPEAYVVRDGHAVPVSYEGAGYLIQPMDVGLVAIIACDPQRCLLVDAFLPHF
jgi:hypothetical protein